MYIRRTSSHVVAEAPAKVNLFLEVLARRSDGYHEIETLMAAVTLFDTLTLASTDGATIDVQCEWARGWAARALHIAKLDRAPGAETGLGDLPQGMHNIVYRAVDLLRRRGGVAAGANVHLTKRIPSAAGLGGASSDAAAALLAANVAWNLNWTRQQLRELAAEIGSDVPFFLGDEAAPAAAVCRGRGEKIEPVRAGRLHLVIVRPATGLSTPAVYGRSRVPDVPATARDLEEGLASGNLARIGKQLKNRLQAPAEELTPWIGRLERSFNRQPVVGHQMSGSGSSYFGICRHARQARRIAANLRGQRLGSVFRATTMVRM